MVKKMSGGDLTDEQKEMMAKLVGGARCCFNADTCHGTKHYRTKKGGAMGDQRRFMANRAVPNRVPNAVRVREMDDVKNYNRQQQQRVFDMEKRQVQGESESIKPIDAKDAGAAFKLQSYISKLQQILGQKADLFSQIQASPFNDLNQLKGTTKQSSLLTMIASKAEFLQAYNEMVSYVFLFFKDVQLDNRVKDRMYAAYFAPLMDQMKQLGDSYPNLFRGIPAPNGTDRQIKVYELVRKELRDMYSLLNVAADNINDGIFRTIGPKDVAEYSRDNDVNATFAVNPPPPAASVPSMAVRQAAAQLRMADEVQAGNARAAQARAAEIAERDPYDPRGDLSLSPQQQAGYAAIQDAMRQQEAAPDTILPVMSAAELQQAYRERAMPEEQLNTIMGRMFASGILLGATTTNQLQQVIQEQDEAEMLALVDRIAPAIQVYNDWVVSRGVLAPPEEDEGRQGRPRSPPRRDPAPPPRSPSPQEQRGQRDQSLPLQEASPDQINAAIEDYVRRSQYPNSRALPVQDSGRGEFGGERWKPLASIALRLRDNGFRAASQTAIKTRIKAYNQALKGRKKAEKQQQGQERVQLLLNNEPEVHLRKVSRAVPLNKTVIVIVIRRLQEPACPEVASGLIKIFAVVNWILFPQRHSIPQHPPYQWVMVRNIVQSSRGKRNRRRQDRVMFVKTVKHTIETVVLAWLIPIMNSAHIRFFAQQVKSGIAYQEASIFHKNTSANPQVRRSSLDTVLMAIMTSLGWKADTDHSSVVYPCLIHLPYRTITSRTLRIPDMTTQWTLLTAITNNRTKTHNRHMRRRRRNPLIWMKTRTPSVFAMRTLR